MQFAVAIPSACTMASPGGKLSSEARLMRNGERYPRFAQYR